MLSWQRNSTLQIFSQNFFLQVAQKPNIVPISLVLNYSEIFNPVILYSVLKDLLSQIRLDFNDFCMAVPMAGFMFLYLGRYKDAYDFIKFWILRADDQEECGGWEK